MDSSTTLPQRIRRWIARIDRERATDFSRFLLRRFLDDSCFEVAGSLAYTTMFALVPFSAVVFVVLSAFPEFRDWSEAVTSYLFANFVPASAGEVRGALALPHKDQHSAGDGRIGACLCYRLLSAKR